MKLASLPLGLAGRATVGFGKRVTGLADEILGEQAQRRTAEHLFSVLGQLKGGAMKLGQALSVFEATLPEHLAAPYRQALTKLQNAAPPLPAAGESSKDAKRSRHSSPICRSSTRWTLAAGSGGAAFWSFVSACR
jgi:predicted unusual protein kinase regulating ubiquinone biosynthesis (AarF/ABC1/UbiB family)